MTYHIGNNYPGSGEKKTKVFFIIMELSIIELSDYEKKVQAKVLSSSRFNWFGAMIDPMRQVLLLEIT